VVDPNRGASKTCGTKIAILQFNQFPEKTWSFKINEEDGMKRNRLWFLLFAAPLMLGMGIVGCSENSLEPGDGVPPASVTNEAEALQYYAIADEFVVNEDEAAVDRALEPADFGGIELSDGPIIPVTWGRFVEDVAVTTTTEFEPGDELATVQISKDITGTLRIMAKRSEDDTTMFLVEKPFSDHSVRNVVFRRVGRETDRFWLNWIPVSTSLVDGKTVAPPADQDVNLTELELVKPNGETITITEPTDVYLRYRWRNLRHDNARTDVPELSKGDMFTVRATLVSSSADTDLVALRYGVSPISKRKVPMMILSETDNGDGTFTRVFEVTADVFHQPGFFHATVVAASKKTLNDDDPLSYSVNWWGMPYRVL